MTEVTVSIATILDAVKSLSANCDHSANLSLNVVKLYDSTYREWAVIILEYHERHTIESIVRHFYRQECYIDTYRCKTIYKLFGDRVWSWFKTFTCKIGLRHIFNIFTGALYQIQNYISRP